MPAPRYTTVTELVIAHAGFGASYYCKDGKPTNEVRMIVSAIKIACQLYGRTPASEFGPLPACRGKMIEKDWSRDHIRNQVERTECSRRPPKTDGIRDCVRIAPE